MQKPEPIRIALRLDDPSLHSNHGLESAIIEALEDHGMPATFAVIPFSSKQEDLAPLRGEAVPHLVEASRRGVLEIALHGHSHTARTTLGDNNRSEFATRPLAEQKELLAQGKACLEAIFGTVHGFVPPWNSFDASTMDALKQLDFRYLSGGWDYTPSNLAELPVLGHSCNLAHLKEAIAEARTLQHLSPVIVAIMHHYDFAESGSDEANIDIPRFRELLAYLKQQEDIEIITLAELSSTIDGNRCSRNIRYHHWRSHQHWRVNELLPKFLLLDQPAPRFYFGIATRVLRRLPRALTG